MTPNRAAPFPGPPERMPPLSDDEFRTEMRRRLEELKSGAAVSVPGDEVMDKLRKQLAEGRMPR